MPGTYTAILVHVIFSTKDRKPYITDSIQQRLYSYIGGIIKKENAQLYAVGGMPDHVHLFIRSGVHTSIASLVRTIKSRSSRWIHTTFDGHKEFGWQDGYAVFSVSPSQARKVRDYIHSQKEHHKKCDVRQELIALFQRHDIEFDERYL